MSRMSASLMVSAAASTLAMAALALSTPAIEHGAQGGASLIPASAELPAPSFAWPPVLRR